MGWVNFKDDEGVLRYKQCDCLKDEIKRKKIQFANIPKEFQDLTIKSFDISLYKTERGKTIANNAKKLCVNYVKEFEKIKEMGKGLYLYSNIKGSGKTRMAVSVANALMKHKDVNAKFTTAVKLLEEIKKTYNSNTDTTEDKIMTQIMTTDVLILDDIGTEVPKNWVNEKLYSIINERMINNRVTIFTSNCEIRDLSLDDRIKNRIKKMTIPIEFPSESIRNYISDKENEILLKELIL